MQTIKSIKSSCKTAAVAGVVAACASNTYAVPISLVNQGFETGDLTGWMSLGDVFATGEASVITSNGTNYVISPHETTMAQLDSSGASVIEIENFLGIDNGSLFGAQDNNSNFQLTNGSAIYQSFFAEAGDTIDMSWNYVARDYVPFTDPSFGILVAPDGSALVEVLASTTGPGLTTGSDGISGVFTFAEQLTQSGEYKLGFVTTNSGDTILNSALFLDDAPGGCNPNCNDLGSPENPLLPTEDDTPESSDFSFIVTEPTTPIFIDPEVAIGYDYVVNSGPNMASVIFPDVGDGVYEVYGWSGSNYDIFLGDAFAGIEFNLGLGGVDKFQVLGIETSEMLDPTDPTAFVTGLTFTSAGAVDMTQSAVTLDVQSVPEGSIVPLMGIGFISFCYLRRRTQQKAAALNEI